MKKQYSVNLEQETIKDIEDRARALMIAPGTLARIIIVQGLENEKQEALKEEPQ